MDNKGEPYFKAWLKTKKLMVEVMEIPLNNYYITPKWNEEDEGDKNNG